MPMGIVNNSDFEKEVSNSLVPDSVPPPTVIVPEVQRPIITTDVLIKNINRGRGEGNVEVPQELRKLIADTHLHEGRDAAMQVASDLGISSSSVSAYSNGATSTKTYNKPNDDLNDFIDGRKSKLTKKALARMNLALMHLTDEKLQDVKPRELAAIAKDMGSIVKDMAPKKDESSVTNNNGPTFVLYTPQVRKLEHYETVVAKDNY